MPTRPTSGILLYTKDKKVLLQHRSDDAPRNPGAWGFFGGGLEEGETPIEAVVRETYEELEYKLADPQLIDTLEYEHEGLRVVLYAFAQEYDGQPLVLREGQAYGWFSTDEAMEKFNIPEQRAALAKLCDKIFTA